MTASASSRNACSPAVSRLLFRTPSLQMSDAPEQLALLERVFEVYSYICQIIYRTELYSNTQKQWFKTSISKWPNGIETTSPPKSSSCFESLPQAALNHERMGWLARSYNNLASNEENPEHYETAIRVLESMRDGRE